MQDVGSKKDMELNSEDLSLSWRELAVESPGHCQCVGKLDCTLQRYQGPCTGILDSDSFLLKKHPVDALTTIQFAGLLAPEASYSVSVPSA